MSHSTHAHTAAIDAPRESTTHDDDGDEEFVRPAPVAARRSSPSLVTNKRTLEEASCAIEDGHHPPTSRLRMMDTNESYEPVTVDVVGFEEAVEAREDDHLGATECDDDQLSYTTDSTDSGTVADIEEPRQRRQMLDLSINKLHTMNNRAPSLRKSVLIFNTMKYLQDEIESENASPVSSVDDDYEIDVPDVDEPVEPSSTTFNAPSPNTRTAALPVEPAWSTGPRLNTANAWTPTAQDTDPHSNIAGEILLSYEMLNNRSYESTPSSAAGGGCGVGASLFAAPLHPSTQADEDDDDDGMDEAQVIAALGLTDVVQAIMAD